MKFGKNLKTWYCCVLLPKYLENLKKFKKISKNRCQGCHISWFLHRICPICTSYQSTLKSWKSDIVGIHWNQNHASRELCIVQMDIKMSCLGLLPGLPKLQATVATLTWPTFSMMSVILTPSFHMSLAGMTKLWEHASFYMN